MASAFDLFTHSKLAWAFAFAAIQADCLIAGRSSSSTSGATSGIIKTLTGDAALSLLFSASCCVMSASWYKSFMLASFFFLSGIRSNVKCQLRHRLYHTISFCECWVDNTPQMHSCCVGKPLCLWLLNEKHVSAIMLLRCVQIRS